jgi:hypothetical protein
MTAESRNGWIGKCGHLFENILVSVFIHWQEYFRIKIKNLNLDEIIN